MGTRLKWAVGGLFVVATIVFVLPAVQVCRDWAFIDRHSGSRKGYREWPLGWRTGQWYQESAIERFMRSHYPAEFQQDWVSYAGTGRNAFGRGILHGHGRPGRILQPQPEWIRDFCRGRSDSELRHLYDVLASAEPVAIQKLVDEINESALAAKESQPVGPTKGGKSIHPEKKQPLPASDPTHEPRPHK